ncbi:hypothetical protein [Rhizobium sp. SG741]|uniref:hypothetical protein n=1 Tax=Rhizobium sp. SG741 TaxID=2587114 RepID=UPI001447CC26|nr:hypothetical protein [Rhizobium sp. SG741]NKJ07967.1 hypothetical protein [Rhizobium sp. SG741]
MAGTALGEASRIFTLLHIRKIQRMAQHTLDEIAARFPAHLIDDVNARGLPPDRTLLWPEKLLDSRNGSYFDSSR